MTLSSLFAIAWRQTRRDLRGGEFNLLLVALVLAVAVSTAIGLFSEQLQKGMGRQVAAVLGADLVVQGSQPIAQSVEKVASDLGIVQVRTIEFPSVIVANDNFQMVSAKGVEAGYPLRGLVRIARSPFGPDKIAEKIPGPGEAWLEPRLFPLLGVTIGDKVSLGEKELIVTRAITLESDRGKGFYSFSPRLLFNLSDLEQTGLVQPGSRVAWRNLYAGPDQKMESFRGWLADYLPEQYRLLDIEESNQGISRSLSRVTGFLALSAQLAVLLAGIAIAMAARRFAHRRYDVIAVFRCMGASRLNVLVITFLQLLFILPFALPPALLTGWLLNQGVITLLSGLLPAWMPSAGVKPLLMGALSGVVILLGFALAPLLQLGKVTPLRVLKKEAVPTPLSTWFVYSLALISLVSISWYLTGNLSLTLSLTVGTLIFLPLVACCLWGIVWLFSRFLTKRSVALVWRVAIRRLIRQRSVAVAQLLAFSLTLMVMAVALMVRTDLLDQWQEQLPESTPNYFTLNIQPDELNRLSTFLETRKINASQMFPIVRGRLTEINNQPIDQTLDGERRRDPALNRELNLTWSDTLPEMDSLEEGRWWSANSREEVSVEARLAERLGLELGDWLTFSVAGRALKVKVTSLRTVEWENFRPNFYMVMPEAALADYPATWLNSFYLPAEQRHQLNDLIRDFPVLTLIDMDTIIFQARTMISQGVIALEIMLVVLLIAGLLVLWASVSATMGERLEESALLRAFGCQAKQLRKLQAGEFVVLGGLAGTLAAIGSELCTWLIFTRVMNLSWEQEPLVWLFLPVVGVLVISAAGYFSTLSIVRISPLRLLKENS